MPLNDLIRSLTEELVVEIPDQVLFSNSHSCSSEDIILRTRLKPNDLVVCRRLAIWILDVVAFGFYLTWLVLMQWKVLTGRTIEYNHLLRALPTFARIVFAPDWRLSLREFLVAWTGNFAFEWLHVPARRFSRMTLGVA